MPTPTACIRYRVTRVQAAGIHLAHVGELDSRADGAYRDQSAAGIGEIGCQAAGICRDSVGEQCPSHVCGRKEGSTVKQVIDGMIIQPHAARTLALSLSP